MTTLTLQQALTTLQASMLDAAGTPPKRSRRLSKNTRRFTMPLRNNRVRLTYF